MTEILIHIGTHKTGTTALQKYLHHNRDKLAQAGWYYPLSGISIRPEHFGHHDIAWHFTKQKSTDFGGLFREIDACGSGRIILSSEDFESVKNPDAIRSVFSMYRIKILVYFRRQDDFLLSSFNQLVKMGLYGKSLRAFRQGLENNNRLDYYAFCDRWAESFGRENILARVYDPKKSIIDCFLETLGIVCRACEYPAFADSNRSLDARLIGTMRAVIQLRKQGIDGQLFDQLINVIRNYDPDPEKSKGDRRYSLLSTKERLELLDTHQASNQMPESVRIVS